MIGKKFEEIQKSDVDFLISEKVAESKTMEYKQELPGNSDSDKKEFLADVSSFGNASGGDIVFGICEAVDESGRKTGVPESVTPITNVIIGREKLRLEEIIRNSLDPRLRVQIKEISGWGEDGKGFVVLIRIPKSFVSPHMVTYGGSSKFYSRNSAGKYPLDVGELRAAFNATEGQNEKIKRFRENRLGQIAADETPVKLSSPRRIVLHLIPINQFLNDERLDMSLVDRNSLISAFRPLGSGVFDYRFNIDGFVSSSVVKSDGSVSAYCQLFNNGVVEYVNSEIVKPDNPRGVGPGLPSVVCEMALIQAVNTCLIGYEYFGLLPPVLISIALLGCEGTRLLTGGDGGYLLDRNVLILPETIIDSLEAHRPIFLKPIFNSLWNSFGFQRCFNYNENGDYRPPNR